MVTIERWEYDNPSQVVATHYPVSTTALDGKPVEKTVAEVEHRQTGERCGDRPDARPGDGQASL